MTKAFRKGVLTMVSKVKVAFVDKDLKIRRVGAFPLTDDGEKINIYPKGGKGNENPIFQKTSALSFRRRSMIPPFRVYFDDVYFMKTGGTACFDFKDASVTIPALDRDRIKESLGATMLNDIGKPKEPFPTWVIWIILALSIFSVLLQMGVVNV